MLQKFKGFEDLKKQLEHKREFSKRDLGGTPLYLSPEQRKLVNSYSETRRDQLEKLPREKVDIYAAGLVLYEMCAQFKTMMGRSMSINKLTNKREFSKEFE